MSLVPQRCIYCGADDNVRCCEFGRDREATPFECAVDAAANAIGTASSMDPSDKRAYEKMLRRDSAWAVRAIIPVVVAWIRHEFDPAGETLSMSTSAEAIANRLEEAFDGA